MNLLWTENLEKNFGKLKALSGINLAVQKDELRAIIGPNGAGKTTFFNVISGKFPPTIGKVYFNGEEITGLKPFTIAQKGITRAFQIINIFPNLSVLENIFISLLNRHKKNLDLFTPPKESKEIMEGATRVLENVGLEKAGSLIAHTLSQGDKKKLDIGMHGWALSASNAQYFTLSNRYSS